MFGVWFQSQIQVWAPQAMAISRPHAKTWVLPKIICCAGQDLSLAETYIFKGENKCLPQTYIFKGENKCLSQTYMFKGETKCPPQTYISKGGNKCQLRNISEHNVVLYDWLSFCDHSLCQDLKFGDIVYSDGLASILRCLFQCRPSRQTQYIYIYIYIW